MPLSSLCGATFCPATSITTPPCPPSARVAGLSILSSQVLPGWPMSKGFWLLFAAKLRVTNRNRQMLGLLCFTRCLGPASSSRVSMWCWGSSRRSSLIFTVFRVGTPYSCSYSKVWTLSSTLKIPFCSTSQQESKFPPPSSLFSHKCL